MKDAWMLDSSLTQTQSDSDDEGSCAESGIELCIECTCPTDRVCSCGQPVCWICALGGMHECE
jgi:hypothetical protein